MNQTIYEIIGNKFNRFCKSTHPYLLQTGPKPTINHFMHVTSASPVHTSFNLVFSPIKVILESIRMRRRFFELRCTCYFPRGLFEGLGHGKSSLKLGIDLVVFGEGLSKSGRGLEKLLRRFSWKIKV